MLFFILAFLLGDFCLQNFSTLPSYQTILFLLLSVPVVLLFRKLKWLTLLAGFILGFAYTAWYAQNLLQWSLPKEWESKPMLISGYIKSIPVLSEFGAQFEFAPTTIPIGIKSKPSILIRLNWRDPPTGIKVGDHWQLQVRLKRIHGIQSPGAFDYEAWAIQNRIRASGYIIASTANRFLDHSYLRYPLNQIRQKILFQLQTVLPTSSTSHWLPALIVGERQGLAQNQWQVLRNTGTNHLMAIGGLHIGMLAGFIHLSMNWFWRKRTTFMLRLPTPHACAIASLSIAILYSALAGFSVPTQRACFMLLIYNIAMLRNVVINPWYVWALALISVLVLNPLVILSESFWLSFMTLALIIYGMAGRLAPTGWWWKWGRVQWVIGVGLIPITLILFQQATLISFIANSIAIPWLALFILPFCFLSSIFLFIQPQCAKFLLIIADKSLGGLWIILSWLAHVNLATWIQVLPNPFYFITMTIGFILLLIPRGIPGRWLGIIFLLPCFLYPAPRPRLNEAWVTILDVGQGLSTVIQTQKHTLVYDAGPKFNVDLDMGENVVLPFLRTQYVKSVDKLVVSHGDNDHIGGAAAIIHALPITTILTSVPEKFPTQHAQLCRAKNTWQWDGVTFTFLYPDVGNLNANNDSSCVLKISNGWQSVILPGDIEKYAEKQLLEKNILGLATNYFIAPHHGSKTSGVKKFLQAVHPQWVFYSTGYKNRYHFPHKSVVANYEEINAKQLNTAELGTLQFKLRQGQMGEVPHSYRKESLRYWRDK